MSSYVYSPKEVYVYYVGESLMGFSDGTFLEVEILSNEWTPRTGIDGVTSYHPKYNMSGTCTLTLQQGSTGNEFLSFLVSQIEQNMNPNILEAAQSNLSIVDTSGTFNLLFENAVIIKQPNITFGKEAQQGPRKWVFHSSRVSYYGEIDEPVRTRSVVQRGLDFLEDQDII
tara:strand:- start:227 stop:739 length:513 start_codon:yes stop_codon:yes gene_type:complete